MVDLETWIKMRTELSKDDWLEFMSGFSMDSTPILMGIHPGAYGNAHALNAAWEIHSGISEIPLPIYLQR